MRIWIRSKTEPEPWILPTESCPNYRIRNPGYIVCNCIQGLCNVVPVVRLPVPDNGLVIWESEFGHDWGGDSGCHTSPTQAAPPTGPAISNHNNVHIIYLYVVGYSRQCCESGSGAFLQCFGSVFIFSGSGSRVWGWRPIRIRIRIQSGTRA